MCRQRRSLLDGERRHPPPAATPAYPVQAPFTGIITRWRFRGGCCTENAHPAKLMTLRVFRAGLYDYNPYPSVVPVETGSSLEIPTNGLIGANVETVVPTRTPIVAGQRFGLQVDPSVAFAVYEGATGAETGSGNGATEVEQYLGTNYAGNALAIAADLEPDADGDLYGDVTQDCAPTDPAKHACAASKPPVYSPPVIPPPVYKPGGGCTGACGGGGVVTTGGGRVTFTGVAPPAPSKSGSTVFIPVACPAALKITCGGYLIAEVPPKAKKAGAAAKKRSRVVGKVRFDVKPGKKKKLKLKLSKSARKTLVKKRKLTILLTVKPDHGKARTVRKTLRLPKKKKPKRRH